MFGGTRRWACALVACAATLAVLPAPGARAESRPVAVVDSATSTPCPNRVVEWKVLMRFWPRSGLAERPLPSLDALRAGVTRTRDDFIDVSGCVVDVSIALAPQPDGRYEAPAGASRHAGNYDIVWDSFAGTAEQTRFCGLINTGFPEHIESPSEGCTDPEFVPYFSLFAHEWWHGAVEHTLPLLGVTRDVPDIHDQDQYGYPAGFGGLVQFYRDMFAGRTSPNGRAQGVSASEWGLGTNRGMAAAQLLRGSRVSPSRLRLSQRRGVRFSFVLSGPARVEIWIAPDRRDGGLKRFRSFRGRAGRNVVTFRGRVGRTRLRPGRYRAEIRASAGSEALVESVRFRVTRR